MKHHAGLAIIIAGLVGAALWMLSPFVTGHQEPWDAGAFYYIGSLIAGGVVSGLLAPKPLWAHYVGTVLGQVAYVLLFLELGPLFVIGFSILLVYALLFVGGAFFGSRIRLRLSGTTSTSSNAPKSE